MQKRIFSRREAAWENKLASVTILDDPLSAHEVEDAIVLPVRKRARGHARGTYSLEGLFEGGVATKRHAFVAGSLRNSLHPQTNYSCCAAYRPKGKIEVREERVVFGGVLYGHYGHMLMDGLSRMWWFAQNSNTPLKLVFVLMPGESSRMAQELLRLMGLDESRYEIIDRPTQFSSVLVPDEGVFSLEGKAYRQWLDLFNLIRNRCVEGSDIEPKERIYLTRTQLPNNDGVGEEYYEKLFLSYGYEVIAPETLPLADQVKLYACAKEIACTMGTLSHAALFATDGARLTCLLRCGATIMPQLIVNEARRLDWKMCDAFLNVLPTEQGYGAYLYAPTKYFASLAEELGWEVPPTDDDARMPDDLVAPYLRLWLKTYADPKRFDAICGKSMFDVLNSLSISLDGVELQRKAYGRKKSLVARAYNKLTKGHSWLPSR